MPHIPIAVTNDNPLRGVVSILQKKVDFMGRHIQRLDDLYASIRNSDRQETSKTMIKFLAFGVAMTALSIISGVALTSCGVLSLGIFLIVIGSIGIVATSVTLANEIAVLKKLQTKFRG